MKKKKKSRIPKSAWGYRGCAGKGGKSTNAVIMNKENDKDKETNNHE